MSLQLTAISCYSGRYFETLLPQAERTSYLKHSSYPEIHSKDEI